MAKENLIDVVLFDTEIGKLGFDVDERKSYFQYNPDFLESGRYTRIFPYLVKRISSTQVFNQFEGATFRGLPSMIADSLPDVFGMIIFKEWLEANHKTFDKITPLEQLSYVGNRGMGALEYKPVKDVPKSSSVSIDEMVTVLKEVLDFKKGILEKKLSDLALINLFKIGTSAGGARPKILVSEHRISKEIIPGDLEVSSDYNHYIVKLCLNEEEGYNKEKVEYIYYRLATAAGIQMMPCKIIDDKHFATLRFDRQDGEKKHILTVSGLTGWDFMKTDYSSYENIFKLMLDLKVPYRDLQEMYRRMIFNVVFANIDDHLKNHSFIYNKEKDDWSLGPAYDITYPLNIKLNYLRLTRALSINTKRSDINLKDVLMVADAFSIKNPKKIIQEVQSVLPFWEEMAVAEKIPEFAIKGIRKEFRMLLE
ncbi:type II toxin-antitoxin system HipA family toxin [Flavobacterium sp. SUN046]|uniref:type II toxin-antitoxin system HipA family toxin n=1 Tax=Flavobacterium sp. SUN046 TaxID=3002440 RepID=UPI002DBD6C5F|nr:type II toxin-antitoxin system HipA family toxin [Flavobacterium sp. SUN046]MEC4049327.1 type II toxin-antitoxin system HipA family toxin [Flavobacterium sp. SUN046]